MFYLYHVTFNVPYYAPTELLRLFGKLPWVKNVLNWSRKKNKQKKKTLSNFGKIQFYGRNAFPLALLLASRSA